ncbi:hypothetical protein SAMN05216436_11631 [bacterium A37T11]|nr:hypothetical protein SAMN05216436_11631 [bacterium A37T11]
MNEHFSTNEPIRVQVNYEDHLLPESVKEFKPVVFQEGKAFRCLSDVDDEEIVTGSGETTEMAIADWDQHLRESLTRELVEYMKLVWRFRIKKPRMSM